MMIEVRAVNARKVLLAQWPAKIETKHFGADGPVESANFDLLILLIVLTLANGKGVARRPSGSGGKGIRHGKLFVVSDRGTPLGRSQMNVPAAGREDNEANAIRLSAGVINPML
ncbi:hypothetical protein AB3X85_23940 [Paraburkholderia phenoliruptrix]|uniref:hypothetical protein n=1 Tax=Paraburkholderia phenoliruptrix TaxID=252970 RepID=UPI0034CE9270